MGRKPKRTEGMPEMGMIMQRAIVDLRNYYRTADDDDKVWLRDRVLQLERDCPYLGVLRHCKYRPLSQEMQQRVDNR
jgi:hypothetical protein